ncbi:hypothetical protein SAMN02745165_01365 [Malonomonas rubra DSM 5091]|uniref:Uncharacterized protein n=1 Tax=Malonomonas rubra DSM 5091 TaxID=1122189 RepID=A0A1M6FPV8_MALRU|nr:hypothetical protein [Malonomonas rubra]SHI99703.1 hypothetical protein SAMN02745165_01365 [Malonomonas rubra DSM 5091]
MNLKGIGFCLLFSCLLGAQITEAEDPLQDQRQFQEQLQEYQQSRMPKEDAIYGWQLMSEEERAQYREQLQLLKTEKEKERYRYLHRENMRSRVEEQGESEGYRRRPGSREGIAPGRPSGAGSGKQ